MKKFLLLLGVAIPFLSFLTAFNVSAQATGTGTASFTAAISWKSNLGTPIWDNQKIISLTITQPTGSNPTWSSPQFRVSAGNVLTITAVEGKVLSKVVIGCSSSGYAVSSTSASISDGSLTLNNATSTIEFQTPVQSLTITAKAAIRYKTISVSYQDGSSSQLANPELSFPADAYTAQLGGSFEAPNATAKSNGKISYESSKPEVATVNATTGEVSVVSVGETVIKATIAETEEYKAGSVSYTLTVVDPKAPLAIYSSAMGEDFNFENVEGQTYPWQHSSQYGLKGSAYIGKVIACEGIAFSPVIDLTGYKELSLSFSNAFNNYKVSNQMIPVSEFPGKYAFVVVREEGATEWTILDEPTAPTAFSWTFYENAPIDLNAYAGKKIQFGFKYVSTANCAGTWEVKGISINGKIDGTPELPTVEIANGYVTGDAGKGNLISYMYEVVSSRTLVDAETWSKPEAQTVSLPVSELTANGTRDAYVYFQAVNPLTDDKSPVFANLVSKSGNLTGVEGVEAEGAEAPVEYYNLQGVRVENPESGLYIRRQGNKTTKVIL